MLSEPSWYCKALKCSLYKKNFCCYSCDLKLKCDNTCLNNPEKCGVVFKSYAEYKNHKLH